VKKNNEVQTAPSSRHSGLY